jgi:hypothetical protein
LVAYTGLREKVFSSPVREKQGYDEGGLWQQLEMFKRRRWGEALWILHDSTGPQGRRTNKEG